MAWLVRQGKLVPVLPGIYAPPELAHNVEVLMRAVCLRHPEAVVLGAAAARASFWPDAPVKTIHVAAATRLASRRGYTFSRRHIPAELVVERAGLRYTSPPLTAIDLATFECADAIDIALRTRAATLEGMYQALRLTRNRIANQQRLELLIDSRERTLVGGGASRSPDPARCGTHRLEDKLPCSPPRPHLLHRHRIPASQLAIEIDGRLHEDDEDLFESDRWRQNALVMNGWLVLRFTWLMLLEHPEVVVAAIAQALLSRKVTLV